MKKLIWAQITGKICGNFIYNKNTYMKDINPLDDTKERKQGC